MALGRSARTLFLFLQILTVHFVISGCSAVTIDNDSPPEAQYAEGERLLQKDRYLEAVERFRILKSRYPYSKYAALATLKIGDAHFQEEAYIEAASAYKIFRELYPRHEMASYALFRMGESYYKTVPDTIDRDLEPANSAIQAYTQLLKEYPGSPHQKEAEERITELRTKLAEKETYVGDFYYQRDLYESAAGRYAYLLQNYPAEGKSEDNLYKLAYSYEQIGDFRRAGLALDLLEQDYKEGGRANDARKLRERVQTGLEKSE